jgi:hypothetical protein
MWVLISCGLTTAAGGRLNVSGDIVTGSTAQPASSRINP